MGRDETCLQLVLFDCSKSTPLPPRAHGDHRLVIDARHSDPARHATPKDRTIGGDGLLMDPRAGRATRASPQGRRRGGRKVRPPQRFVDQRLLQGLRPGDGCPRMDRDDLAGGVRRRGAATDQSADRGRGAHRRGRSHRRDVVRRSTDGSDADPLRHRRSTGRVPARNPVGRDHVVHRDVRTGFGLRPRVAHHERRTRRR